MKQYRQLLKELPSNKVVFAFGRFSPPTTGHELIVKTVKKISESQRSDHIIFAADDLKETILSQDKKSYYMNIMFPGTNVKATDLPTIVEAAKELNKKYKNIIMVTTADCKEDYQKILNSKNGKDFFFETIEVIVAGDVNPDKNSLKESAKKGDYYKFKKSLPSAIREIDGRRLMNEIRLNLGLDSIREQVIFSKDKLREKFFKGEIYNIGQFVESNNQRYEILDRGSNYLVVVDTSGTTSRKWIQDVTLSSNQIKEDISGGYAPSEISFKGYTTKNFHYCPDAAKAFQDTILRVGSADPVAVLNAIKATDSYLMINDEHLQQGEAPDKQDLKQWNLSHAKAKESLDRVGEFLHHQDYWHAHGNEIEGMNANYTPETAGQDFADEGFELEGIMIPEELTDKTLRPTDKIKVARIIADMLGVGKVESTANPENLVNTALRKVKSKALNAEGYKILEKMLQLATEVGINYDTSLKPAKLKEEGPTVVAINKSKKNNISKGIMSMKDFKRVSSTQDSKGDDFKNNDSDLDAEQNKETGVDKSEVGHTIVHASGNDQLRRRRVRYALGEASKLTALDKWRRASAARDKKQAEHEAKMKALPADQRSTAAVDALERSVLSKEAKDPCWTGYKQLGMKKKNGKQVPNCVPVEESLNEDSYEDAEGHLDKADKAQRNKDMFSHHMHMADHHDSLSQWHDSKGRSSAAEKHANKAADHEEMAHAIKQRLKEETLTESHAELDKHISDFSKGINSDGAKHSTYKNGGGKIHNMKHVSTDAEHHAIFKHLQKMGYKKTSGHDSKPHEFDMHHNHDSMTTKSDPVHHSSGISAHIEKEHGGSTKVHFTHNKLKEEIELAPEVSNDQNLEDQLATELDLTDEQIDHIIQATPDEEIEDEFEEEEYHMIDDETGEPLPADECQCTMEEQAILEVLSRTERMRAKVRFAKSKSKRQVKASIALKSHAPAKKVNQRARRLAIKLMKKRMLRGRDYNKISVGEKERIERVITKRKQVIDRVALKLIPRIRNVEKARLSHHKYNASSNNNLSF
jgi:hypothetical protein